MNGALKALVAALSAGLVVLHTVLLTGGAVSWADWQTIADAVLGPILVYFVPNVPAAPVVIAPAVAPSSKTLLIPEGAPVPPLATVPSAITPLLTTTE